MEDGKKRDLRRIINELESSSKNLKFWTEQYNKFLSDNRSDFERSTKDKELLEMYDEYQEITRRVFEVSSM